MLKCNSLCFIGKLDLIVHLNEGPYSLQIRSWSKLLQYDKTQAEECKYRLLYLYLIAITAYSYSLRVIFVFCLQKVNSLNKDRKQSSLLSFFSSKRDSVDDVPESSNSSIVCDGNL